MWESVLRPEVQQYLWEHETVEVADWLLRHPSQFGIPGRLLAAQLAGRQKARLKLPLWYQQGGVVYPPPLNLEQTSSQATAELKQQFVEEHVPHRGRGIDLTGGWGVDSFFLSAAFGQWDFVEPDRPLLEMARHNHQVLGAPAIEYHLEKAEDFLARAGSTYDLAYLDPSRRGNGQQRLVSWADLQPNVAEWMPVLLTRARQVLIKGSPMLDIRQAIRGLTGVRTVYVAGVENECKELVFFLAPGWTKPHAVVCYDLPTRNGRWEATLTFSVEEEESAPVRLGPVQRYVYEPRSTLLKAGAFRLVGHRWGLDKLHPNTHLYTSSQRITSFPGRIFELAEALKPTAHARTFFAAGYANILLRNYPVSIGELMHKTGLQEGGSDYLLGFRGLQKPELYRALRLQ